MRAEKIVNGSLSIDIDPGSNGVCVVKPASRYDAENCADVNVAAERRKFATWQGSVLPVAVMHVREGDARHHVLMVEYKNLRTEFDQESAREFARIVRENMRADWKVAALTPDAQLEPTQVRIQGVQVTSFDATPAIAADDPRRAWSYTLVFAVPTDQAVYGIIFAGAPENAAAVSALASRSLATLRAKPAGPPAPKTPTLAYRVGRAVGALAIFGVLAFILVRALLGKSKANPQYEPEGRP
ncbi:hypothetical protein [Pendulispora rubella]|uniref:hypothetical protein n=1 Tax=Pendulispora rubella TaxID=2741070 RepID=UPI0030E57B8B